MEKRITAGGVVVNDEGKVLLVQNDRLSWSLPKGGVDEGEQMMEAAMREIYEETGIPVEELHLESTEPLGYFERFQGGSNGGYDTNAFKRIYVFYFTTNFDRDLKPLDEENPQAQWVKKSLVAELLTYTEDKEFFSSIIDKI